MYVDDKGLFKFDTLKVIFLKIYRGVRAHVDLLKSKENEYETVRL